MRVIKIFEFTDDEMARYPHLVKDISDGAPADIETIQDVMDDLAGDVNTIRNDIQLHRQWVDKKMEEIRLQDFEQIYRSLNGQHKKMDRGTKGKDQLPGVQANLGPKKKPNNRTKKSTGETTPGSKQ